MRNGSVSLAISRIPNGSQLVNTTRKPVGFLIIWYVYAIVELTPIGLKQQLVTSQSQSGKLDKLSQHAIAQSQAREARHAFPACSGDQS